jgi:hypothetical protein
VLLPLPLLPTSATVRPACASTLFLLSPVLPPLQFSTPGYHTFPPFPPQVDPLLSNRPSHGYPNSHNENWRALSGSCRSLCLGSTLEVTGRASAAAGAAAGAAAASLKSSRARRDADAAVRQSLHKMRQLHLPLHHTRQWAASGPPAQTRRRSRAQTARGFTALHSAALRSKPSAQRLGHGRQGGLQ